MRGLAAALVVCALLLGAARLFTGVVYGADSPVAYFVVKTMPDPRMERPEAKGPPVGSDIVLDTEETQLSYGWLYFGLMRAVPALTAIMIAAAVILLALSRRSPSRSRTTGT